MSNKKKTILIVALLLVVFIGSISYALWSVTLEQTDSNVVKTGCFTVDMVEQTDEINLPEEYPVTDEEGRKYSPFTFTIQNTCTIDSSYSVNLKVEDGTTLEHQYVKAVLDGDKAQVLTDYEKATNEDKYQLTTGTLAGASSEGAGDGESVTYNLRLWLDADTPKSQMSKDFYAKIVIDNITTSVPKVLATGDFNRSSSDAVVLSYYDDGTVKLSGVGAASGNGIIGMLFEYMFTNNSKMSEIVADIDMLSENAQGFVYMIGYASFGGYKAISNLSNGEIDFSSVSNNQELKETALEIIETNGDIFTETDKQLLPQIIEVITSEIIAINNVKIEEGITKIGDLNFSQMGDVSIVLPSTIERIGKDAFADSEITNVVLNEGLKVIEESAFENSFIKSIDLPNSLEHIGYNAFSNSKLESIIIPSSVNVLGYAFSDCSELKTVVWNSDKGLAGSLFQNTPKLTTILINTNIPYITEKAIDDKSINPNLVIKFKMLEDQKETIKKDMSSTQSFDFTNYNVEWGYTE